MTHSLITNREQHPRRAAPAGWQDVVRIQAQSAAELEARSSWQVEQNEEVPFQYRWEHVQQVVRTARWLAEQTGADPEVVEAAAWLHDVRKTEPDHARAGAQAARSILAATDYPPAKVDAVCQAIAQHEGLTRDEETPLQPLEAAVLWDADKLTKLGVQALIYSLSTPRMQGRTLAERLASARSFTDTVLRQTVASMNTSAALEVAVRRYAEMSAALTAWAHDAEIS